MLTNILNTMRVLVDGPDHESDTQLIPTTLFNTREAFNEAVVELLEKAEVANIHDFIRYVVCIDTSIRHRLDENSGGFIDGALIQPDDYVDTLNKIDQTFGVTEEAFGSNVASGVQHSNPAFAGLSGAFVQLVQETLGEDHYNVFKPIVHIFLEACRTNPSTTSPWWLDALNEIYSYEASIDGEDDQWFDPNGEGNHILLLQVWYLHLSNALGKLWEVQEELSQNLPSHSIGQQYMDHILDLNVQFIDEYEDKFEQGLVCERIPALEDMPHNIEQILLVVMVVAR